MEKKQKNLSMICHFFAIVDEVFYVFNVGPRLGQGSNKPPDIFKFPFGQMLARKKYKKILSMICQSFTHLDDNISIILSLYVTCLCFMLILRDRASILIKSTKNIRLHKILFLDYSTISSKKWMTRMATPSAFTFFSSFLLDSLLTKEQNSWV